MLKVIATESLICFEGLERIASPEKVSSNHMADAYRRGDTFYLFLKKPPSLEMVTWIASEFLPERLYFPFLGYSVDTIHEVGDIIVPNVFLEYQKKLEEAEIGKENRDSFVGKKHFIENFSEQKDYYVEDFGLSLWGILVSDAPKNPSLALHEKFMFAYEADLYVSDSVFPAIEVLSSDEVPTVIFAGIIRGKTHSKYGEIDGEALALKNLLTTISLLEDDEEDAQRENAS